MKHFCDLGAHLLALGGLFFVCSWPCAAHEIRPAIVTVTVADATYDLKIVLNAEALIAGIGPEHSDTNEAPEATTYNSLRALPPLDLKARFSEFALRWIDGIRLEFDGQRALMSIISIDVPRTTDPGLARISTISLRGPLPVGASTMRWSYAKSFGASVVRLLRDGADPIELGWFKDGKQSNEVSLRGGDVQSPTAILLSYISVGFTHIIPKGLDHILFVLGLYLLAARWRPLLLQVTAFTVAHSITLGLGLYGYVTVPPSIVEPMIALSIVYVAVENILTSKLTVWRPFIVFGFGLLHGLGFASVLREIGLQPGDYARGLIGFNIGVEVGQLTVIATAFLLTGYWFRAKPWYRQRIILPASAVIAATGAFWAVERIWFA
jgi:hydrogenase/urease accessory protein HupE